MVISPELLRLVCCVLGAITLALIFIGRTLHSRERRVFALLLSILMISGGYLFVTWYVYQIHLEAIIAVLLIELGIFAYVYDAYRPYHSTSHKLRNLGSIYIFIGFGVLLSLATNFYIWAWIVPIVFLSLGYFFIKRRRGLANLFKGAGILVSVAFIASMIYDVKEGTVSSREAPSRNRQAVDHRRSQQSQRKGASPGAGENTVVR